MPKVGMKNFSYDQKGMDQATQEARRTGLPIEYEDRNYAQYNAGGRVMSGRRPYASANENVKKRMADETKPKAAKKKKLPVGDFPEKKTRKV